MFIFINFRVILGVSWDTLWAHVCDFCVILGAKMGGSFQSHVFGDPGMEMMAGCSGACAIDIVKTHVLETFHFFDLFTNLVPGGGFLTFSDFKGYWRQA